MSTLTVAVVLAAMLAEPVYGPDRGEAPEARAELYRPIAEAIVEVSGEDVELASALIEKPSAETHFARYVIEGRCLEGRFKCDRDSRTGLPRARGVWQVWGWCRDAWRLVDGTVESILEEARCAKKVLLDAKVRCGLPGRDPWIGAFSGYGSGSVTCNWGPAEERARARKKIEARLRIGIQSSPR